MSINELLFLVAVVLSALVSRGYCQSSCTAFNLYKRFEEECQYRKFQFPVLAHLALQEDGTFTGEEVIQFIQRDCQSRRVDYFVCAHSLITGCPWDTQEAFLQLVASNQGTACQEMSIAPWIRQFVGDGFTMSGACEHYVSDIANDCYSQHPPQGFDANTTPIMNMSAIYDRQMSEMLPCTVEALRQGGAPSDCTTPWYDQLFHLWLFMENKQPFSHLTPKQTRDLLGYKYSLASILVRNNNKS